MFVSCVCCALCRQRPLRRADQPFSSPSVRARARVCVCGGRGTVNSKRGCLAPICNLSLAPLSFSTLSHKRHDFRGRGGVGEVTEHKMCALIFSTTFV
jgi:hypothetical protein